MANSDFLGVKHYQGVQVRGEDHPQAKLTEELVLQIRAEFAEGGITKTQLASKHGLKLGSVSELILRKKWKHI